MLRSIEELVQLATDSGQLIVADDYLVIRDDALTDEINASLLGQAVYTDKSITYQIMTASKKPWVTPEHLDALRAQETTYLYKIVGDCLVMPQGFLYLFEKAFEGRTQDFRTVKVGSPFSWATKPYDLRYYQREAVDALKKVQRGQAVLATGSGKSLLILHLIKELGLRTLVIGPSSMICGQLHNQFVKHLGKKAVGLYGSGKKEIKEVTVALYQSVARNPDLFKDKFDVVIVDESQYLGASSLRAITTALINVPRYYSVSATNYRADGRTPELYAASGDVVYTFDTRRAIAEGFLAKPSFFVREVASYGRDHDMKQKNYLNHVVKNDGMRDRIVADARKAVQAGKSTLILVQEIDHGESLAKLLGCPFANGENKKAYELIEDLNHGKINLLIAGAQMCGVGVDTVRVDCLIMASFPGSEGLTTQLVGRGLRMYEGKTGVAVLDYIPVGSKMLAGHARRRASWYRDLGSVKILPLEPAEVIF